MYDLIDNLLNIPSQYANSTVTAVCGALVLLATVVLVDFVYRLVKSVFGRSQY